MVIRCTDTDCFRAETLFNQTLGTILVGQAATVLMQWNPPTNGILFRLNANPVIAKDAMLYAAPNQAVERTGHKAVGWDEGSRIPAVRP